IVTNSPKSYCANALRMLTMQCNVVIGYHDTSLRKPFPDPVLLALNKLGIKDPTKSYGFGDKMDDLNSYQSAGIIPIACSWGWSDSVIPAHYIKINSP